MATVIRTTLSTKKVQKLINSIPAIVAGRARDPFKLHKKFWGAVAFSMYESLNKAFETKAQGGIDELGNNWDDLTEHTKAYSRPIYPGDLPRRMRLNEKRSDTIGLLSPGEYKKWRAIYASVLRKNEKKLGTGEAKILAAKVAWSEIKKDGAQTKIDVLGSRDLLILRDSDRLYRSFLPGKLTKHSYRKYNKDQVFIVEKGAVTVGTKVEYAEEVFKQRPLWIGSLAPWIKRASRAGTKRIVDFLKEELRGTST